MAKLHDVIAATRKRDEQRAAKKPASTIDLRSRTTAADLSSNTPIVGTSTTERKP